MSEYLRLRVLFTPGHGIEATDAGIDPGVAVFAVVHVLQALLIAGQ
jgi:hypothetical protein